MPFLVAIGRGDGEVHDFGCEAEGHVLIRAGVGVSFPRIVHDGDGVTVTVTCPLHAATEHQQAATPTRRMPRYLSDRLAGERTVDGVWAVQGIRLLLRFVVLGENGTSNEGYNEGCN